MPRSDKKNRTCDRCGKECANPNKLREHLNRKFKCKPKPIRPKSPELQPPPRPRSPSPVLIDHVRGRDRRKEKPKVVNPIPDLQVVTPTPVPKTESQRDAPVFGRDYITEEEAKNWVNPNARKSGEHYKTWGKRLVQKWKELDLGDHDMPENLHECHTLCHDLEQYDPDAVRPPTLKELEKYSKLTPREDPKAGPGPATQAYREGLPSSIEMFNEEYMKELIGEEEPSEVGQEGLALISQDEVQDGQENIHFEECSVGRDPERPHKNQSLMSKWVGIVPSTNNPAYAFNVPIFGHEYAEIPYIPKLISASRPKIKEVLQTELCRKDQIKSAIVVLCRYKIGNKKEAESEPVFIDKHHRGGMCPILLKGEIDGHITQSVGEINKQVEDTLKKGSGCILERILEISIEAYRYLRSLPIKSALLIQIIGG